MPLTSAYEFGISFACSVSQYSNMEENSEKNIFDYNIDEYLKLPTEEATKLAEKNRHEFEEWCKKNTPEIEGDNNNTSFGDHPYFRTTQYQVIAQIITAIFFFGFMFGVPFLIVKCSS